MDRVQYQLIRKVVQKGDDVYIKSLDGLGRNKQQIKQELEGVQPTYVQKPATCWI